LAVMQGSKNALAALRKARGLNVRDVHHATGLAETTLYRVEGYPSVLDARGKTLGVLMDFYGVSLNDLIDMEREAA